MKFRPGKFFGSGSLYAFGLIAPILAMLVATPLVTRMLGPAEYGVVGVSITLNQALSMLLTLGLPYAITRHAIIMKSGVRGAAGLVALGAAAALVFAFGLALLIPFWGPIVFDRSLVWTLIWPICSASGLALLSLAQAFFRALDMVWIFVLLGTMSSLLGPAAGFALLTWSASNPENYLRGLGIGHLAVGVVAVGVVLIKTVPQVTFREFWESIRISLPTVPHTVAATFLVSIMVILSAQLYGVEFGGQVQLALLLGTAPTVLLGAFNNSWAPMIYRASDSTRTQVLSQSLVAIAALVYLLISGYVVLSPTVVRFIAGPQLFSDDMLAASLVVTVAAPIMALYLANIHLVFLDGRTAPLAFTTPASLALALGATYAIALSLGRPHIWAFAIGIPVFHLAQWGMAYAIRRRTSFAGPKITRSVPILACAAALSVTAAAWLPNTFILLALAIVGALVVYLAMRILSNPGVQVREI